MGKSNSNKQVLKEVYLGLGSNMGDREELLKRAITLLTSEAGNVVQCSSVWETEPWGFEAETSFLNMVVVINTGLNPLEMLKKINSIETRLGRKRSGKDYQSRTIDIDILFWGNDTVNKGNLIIPHPAIAGRLFVLMPLNEIAPDFSDPVTGMTISELLDRCGDKSEIKIFSKT